jgi:Arc/MetJ family transcription regulator
MPRRSDGWIPERMTIYRSLNQALTMRATLTLNDDLLAKAQALIGLTHKSAVVREALKALIERESARRLARLGGSVPEFTAPRRRRRRKRGAEL